MIAIKQYNKTLQGIKASLLLFMAIFIVGCEESVQVSPDDLLAFEKLSVEQQLQSCSQHELSTRTATPFVQFDQAKEMHSNAGLSPLLADAQLRQGTSLNGQWQYLIDQLDMGDKGITMQGGVGLGEQAAATQLIEYAFTPDQTLKVPGDWNSQVPALEWYRGVIWYKKSFNYTAPINHKTYLHFDGAYLKKDIYLNGKLLARHDGGFTAFNTDISSQLKAGDNTLVIKVDSRSDAAGIPTEQNDWMNYGGLTRDVKLVSVPQQHIQNYKLQLDNNDSNTIKGWVQVAGNGGKVTINIPQANITKTVMVNEQGYADFSMIADLRLWQPSNPYRYKVTLQYQQDSIEREIGFRSIKTKENKILLNGKSIFLRGISMHEESMLKMGRANSLEDAQNTIKYLKKLNVNFVRLAHYQHNQYMIEEAEKAGILIWAELPIYHSMAYDNPCTLALAKRQFSEMIERDQNYAAIIFWSISNETPISDARNYFLKSLAQHVRHKDNSRLITSALFGLKKEMERVAENVGKIVLSETGRNGKIVSFVPTPDAVTINLEDPLGEIVDVIGYNQYFGWYISAVATRIMNKSDWDINEDEFRNEMLNEMKRVSIVTNFNKPIIISEFGAGAKQGFVGSDQQVWSEKLQEKVYLSQFELLKNIPDLVGISPWVLKDFRSPYRLNNQFQNYWNRKGLVSETGKTKLAFDALANYYQQIMNKEKQSQTAAN